MSGIISSIGDSLSNVTGSGLLSMFFHIGQSKLGYLSLDILASENLDLPKRKCTKHPVEDGRRRRNGLSRLVTKLVINQWRYCCGQAHSELELRYPCYSKLIDAADQLRKMKRRKENATATGLRQT